MQKEIELFTEIKKYFEQTYGADSFEILTKEFQLKRYLIQVAEEILSSSPDYDRINLNVVSLVIHFLPDAYKLKIISKSTSLLTSAKEFLNQSSISQKECNEVLQILETFNEQIQPTSKIKNVLFDTINSVKGDKAYLDRMLLLRPKADLEYSELEWLELIEMELRQTKFFTQFGIKTYSKRLAKNLEKVRKLIEQQNKNIDKALQIELDVDQSKLKKLKKKLAKIEDRPDRGIETLFRLASRNHFTLNTMVDRKSGILISINSIILSIILSVVLPQIATDPHLIVPIVMLLGTNVTSIVFAILSTRPEKKHGDIGSKEKENLLFYGNFKHLSEEEYVNEMNELMNSSKDLYDEIARDIYYLGQNLKRKFSLLRNSFNVFMYGIIGSVVVFLICHTFFSDFI